MKTFETKDVSLAVYLKLNDFYCIGTIPARNQFRPNERLWLFEESDALQGRVKEFQEGDPNVPVKKAFHSYKILKNLLNDKDE